MKFDRLLTFDQNLRIEKELTIEGIEGIADYMYTSPGFLTLFKEKRYWKRFIERTDDRILVYCFSESLWNEFNDQEKTELRDLSQGILVTTQFDMSLVRLSRPFYEKKFLHLQSEVDGRQLENCTIDGTARISAGVHLGENVKIGKDVVIHPGVRVMSECEIGDGSELFPGVVLYPYTMLGKNVRIHANSVIGGDGFGYQFDSGVHHKIWHSGGVIIGDDVEIGSLTSIDMGTLSPTKIGAGTKIDSSVQIGHNCQIGQGVILCGHVGVSGSAQVGNFVVVGGKAGIGPAVRIGDGCQLAGNSMVSGNLGPGEVVAGHPARPYKDWMRSNLAIKKLGQAKKS